MAGVIIGRNLESLKAGLAAAREGWRALEARGLQLGSEEVSGLAATSGKERPTLSGAIAGCAVEVHVRSDMVHWAHTEVIATPAEGAEVTIGVHPNPAGLMGYLRQWLGQDIEIGDEAFDSAYLITGKPESAARALLVPSVRELVTALGPKLAGLTYRDRRVTVALLGVETDPALLGIALDLAAAAASFRG